MVVRGDKLKLVKEYKREKCIQSKPTTVVTGGGYGGVIRWDEDLYSHHYGGYSNTNVSYKVKYDGTKYIDEKKKPMHVVFYMSSYGYIFPNQKTEANWLNKVAFYQGQLLKHPDAFDLIDKHFKEAKNKITPEVQTLINMLDFNPHTEDCVQYYWYDDGTLMVPTGEWKWPVADWSIAFDGEGRAVDIGKQDYTGWTTDYKMYTYNEKKILEDWKLLCEGE
jgi:hypothetical protein